MPSLNIKSIQLLDIVLTAEGKKTTTTTVCPFKNSLACLRLLKPHMQTDGPIFLPTLRHKSLLQYDAIIKWRCSESVCYVERWHRTRKCTVCFHSFKSVRWCIARCGLSNDLTTQNDLLVTEGREREREMSLQLASPVAWLRHHQLVPRGVSPVAVEEKQLAPVSCFLARRFVVSVSGWWFHE